MINDTTYIIIVMGGFILIVIAYFIITAMIDKISSCRLPFKKCSYKIKEIIDKHGDTRYQLWRLGYIFRGHIGSYETLPLALADMRTFRSRDQKFKSPSKRWLTNDELMVEEL